MEWWRAQVDEEERSGRHPERRAQVDDHRRLEVGQGEGVEDDPGGQAEGREPGVAAAPSSPLICHRSGGYKEQFVGLTR
jgi:hypothetical protein